MKDVIDLLLQKKSTLDADREAEKAFACEKIDAEYAERSDKIDTLLETAGYIPPVEEPATVEPVEEVTAEAETPEEGNTLQGY